MDHDGARITEFVVNDFIVAGSQFCYCSKCSHLAKVCNTSNTSLNLGPPNHDSITTVDGCLLKVIGRVMLPFAIGSTTFPFEAHVIQDLTSKVILGRNFFEKNGAKIDFHKGNTRFKHGEEPLSFDSDPVTLDSGNCGPEFVCSVHVDIAFTIPPESEIIVLGRLNAELPLKKTV